MLRVFLECAKYVSLLVFYAQPLYLAKETRIQKKAGACPLKASFSVPYRRFLCPLLVFVCSAKLSIGYRLLRPCLVSRIPYPLFVKQGLFYFYTFCTFCVPYLLGRDTNKPFLLHLLLCKRNVHTLKSSILTSLVEVFDIRKD